MPLTSATDFDFGAHAERRDGSQAYRSGQHACVNQGGSRQNSSATQDGYQFDSNPEWMNVLEDITRGGYEWYHVHHIPDVPPSGVRSRQGSSLQGSSLQGSSLQGSSRQGSMPVLEAGTVATVSGTEDDEKSMARMPSDVIYTPVSERSLTTSIGSTGSAVSIRVFRHHTGSSPPPPDSEPHTAKLIV